MAFDFLEYIGVQRDRDEIDDALEFGDVLNLARDDPHLEAVGLDDADHGEQLAAVFLEPIKRIGAAADRDKRFPTLADECRDCLGALAAVRQQCGIAPVAIDARLGASEPLCFPVDDDGEILLCGFHWLSLTCWMWSVRHDFFLPGSFSVFLCSVCSGIGAGSTGGGLASPPSTSIIVPGSASTAFFQAAQSLATACFASTSGAWQSRS